MGGGGSEARAAPEAGHGPAPAAICSSSGAEEPELGLGASKLEATAKRKQNFCLEPLTQ